MLRSLYAYKGTHARTLAFSANEKFLEIGVSKDPNWVHVITQNGNLGYVPKNYVAVDNVQPIEMLELIDACIEGINLMASERGGNYQRLEHEALQALVEKRQEWHSKVPPTLHPSKRPAPPPPNRTTSQLSVDSVGSSVSDGSLPSPSTPTPIATTIQTSTVTANSVGETLPFSLPTSLIHAPKRRSSEIETSTSFIGRGDSLAAEEEEDETPRTSNGCENEVNSSLQSSDKEKESNSTAKEEKRIANYEQLPLDIKKLQESIPENYCRYLVEEIRSSTNISFSTSQQVVTLILQSLGSTFPSLNLLFEEILRKTRKGSCASSTNILRWEKSSDGKKLVDLLEKLRQCKDDDQQRSWALHEDEFTIKEHLSSLLDILMNGDLEVCNQVLMLEDHRPLLTLVQYYQMETRWNLRKLLLQIFTVVCQMSQRNISYLSSSVLPVELTREILDTRTTEEELQYTVLVLGMILSMADTLPFTHFSIMNESFVNKVLESIEKYNRNPDTEGLAELYLTLLLAFNLQYHTRFATPNSLSEKSETENLVIKALSLPRDTKYFIEKILILFNREEDPVSIFDHEPQPPHSVLCMIGDMFSCPATAQLLYTNDEKVLCDIILRQLTDLSPEDKRRRQYLCLLEGVVTLGRWKEHQHRRTEFSSRLRSIAAQEDFPRDKTVSERILSIFSKLKTTTAEL